MKQSNIIRAFQISPNPIKGVFRIKHCFPVDYKNLSIDLLDAKGKETNIPLQLIIQADNIIEVVLKEGLSGVFQVRMQDENTYFIKKVIIQ